MLEDHRNLRFLLPGLSPDSGDVPADIDEALEQLWVECWYPGTPADVIAEIDRVLAAGGAEIDDAVLTFRDVEADGVTPAEVLRRLRAIAERDAG